ncbi:hypothetical protein HYW42_00375 [Candidatus Daviesbacteria bacterium]|nr:hypothetical protein [Candidatus Daviesbacteria bacterium]
MMEGIEILRAHRNEFARLHPNDPQVGMLDQWLDGGRVLAAGISTEARGAERLILKARIPDREKQP